MVGLVIVAHSRDLAEALVNFIKPMASPDVRIGVAAGAGPQKDELGTDALEIQEAILSVYSPAGVLVIMDLGSAILSAEMALEFLEPEMAQSVRLCPAPLVEGSLAAAIQIGLGSDLDTVCREARQALLPKLDQLGEEYAPCLESIPTGETAAPAAGSSEMVLTLKNQHGLHARPAAQFVQTAGRFNAAIHVTNLTRGKGPVRAASLNELATLGAVRDHQIRLVAAGPEADLALEALRTLVEASFGETDQPAEAAILPDAPAEVREDMIRGAPVSPGIAIGPFYPYRPTIPAVPDYEPSDPNEEWDKLQRALESTRRTLEQRRMQISSSLGESEAAIFEAHILILQDPALLEQVRSGIMTGRRNAGAAWDSAIQETAGAYRELDDPYLQQRAADVLDVGRQVLFALAGKPESSEIKLDSPVILFAEDLTPTETSQLDTEQILGIVTAAGGGTSHSAILARARGIPAVAGIRANLDQLDPGTLVALDGFSGEFWIDPPQEIQNSLRVRQSEWLSRREELLKQSRELTVTRDGRRVEVFANVGSAQDARTAAQNGAEGVGLLRTEFLFLARRTPPDEASQIAVLKEIGAALEGFPVTVRTLDVGGDKEVPYINLPPEANPFLGVRAIRMSLAHPELFMVQLRAVLQAGASHPFRIMFPMVSTIEEIWQAREWLEKAHQSLLAENLPHIWPIETGIMVETPASAILSPLLAQEVDFFSIGTNDLTQYTMAAERGNTMLTGLMDAMHPAVLRLIKIVADSAHQYNKWVGVCGELAGDPEAAPVLVGLGIDELSLNPGGIPLIKDIVRRINSGSAQKLAGQILLAQTAGQARQLAANFLKNSG